MCTQQRRRSAWASNSSLSAQRSFGSLATHRACSKDSNCVSAGCTCHFYWFCCAWSCMCFVYLQVVTISSRDSSQTRSQLIWMVCDRVNCFFLYCLMPSILFLGLWETVQTPIRRRILRRLIMVYTVRMQEFPFKLE